MQVKHNYLVHLTKVFTLVFCDILLIVASMVGALWIRHDFQLSAIDPEFLETLLLYLPVNLFCTLLVFKLCRLYNNLWQFAGIMELNSVVAAVLLSTLLQTAGMALLRLRIPRSYPFLYILLLFLAVSASRYLIRVLYRERQRNAAAQPDIRTLIVGAGGAGNMLLREIKSSRQVHRVVPCIVDDDPVKRGTYLHGVPVVGDFSAIPRCVQEYQIQEIVIAIPSLSPARKKALLEICQETACKTLTLPGIYQIVNGEVSVSMLRQVDINDLLGRPPVELEMEEIMDYVSGKVILVTGGGGSIGSEICRQLALHRPRLLIVFDIYENSVYDLQHELLDRHPDLQLEVLIGSVRNRARVDSIFETYHPDLVFHAAAHKHVPLMEDSPNEAVKNNVLGTWVVARAADAFGARKMVLISTDKAVRPTNVMGASKRICELVVQRFSQTSKTEFAAVRFGNVLGSNGSVVPLFQKQIEAGGPVTVTHPDIIRYFMTIPEAVNLVLQCGALARGGEVFILDMGEPVKIDDLARKMIRCCGLVPDRDIRIEYIGLRPGEKLYEELLLNEDNLKKTAKDRIFVARQPEVDTAWLDHEVEELVSNAFNETGDIRARIKRLVPEYEPRANRAPAEAETPAS